MYGVTDAVLHSHLGRHLKYGDETMRICLISKTSLASRWHAIMVRGRVTSNQLRVLHLFEGWSYVLPVMEAMGATMPELFVVAAWSFMLFPHAKTGLSKSLCDAVLQKEYSSLMSLKHYLRIQYSGYELDILHVRSE
ncbi:hypothetical protein AVEN_51319-1 [Araneus ventricosus]|uniref:Uncharacterized protein n=1 Tax=Araneus ventricosus TaxID=182803 RepID=A0A4Y2TJK3_ARAVE|nr:hypothetical protein AVEN_51319-1 [Araneus ventricosus]